MKIPPMVRPLAVVVLAAAILAYFGGRSDMEGKAFPFAAEDFGGRIVSNEDPAFAGKVLVVDIWGSWCPPCRAEIPHLNSLYEAYKDKGLEIVGVAFEESGDRASAIRGLNRFIAEYQMKYPVLYGGTPSGSDVRRAFPNLTDFGGFPTTIVIDRQGIVRLVTVGFGPGMMGKIEAAVQDALGGP